MRLADLCFILFRFLLPPALIATTCLYLYPALQGCEFPEAKKAEAACIIPGSQTAAVPAEPAPFRLLALGDPQLEGDTSLPNPNAPKFPSLEVLKEHLYQGDFTAFSEAVGPALQDLVKKDLRKLLKGYQKALDLWGNDLYLAHIYRSVYWWTQPTHTVVLGDLLGSQWISDEEFGRRSQRFWTKVFKHAEKVPIGITGVSGHVETLGQDPAWARRLIAVAGNHDIGYAGDIDEGRIERFEDEYGQVNWDIRLRMPRNDPIMVSPRTGGFLHSSALLKDQTPELHLVILNTMNLDEPALKPHLRQQTLDFLNETFSSESSEKSATILLTHVPLHKERGVCVDSPFFSYFAPHEGGGIREQNHVSEDMSSRILDLITGPNLSRQAIILNGHDHEGCDTFHFSEPTTINESEINRENETDGPQWQAASFFKHKLSSLAGSSKYQGVREITVRSMMGEFSGYAGLLSAWWDSEDLQWKFEFNTCIMGVQHIWWGVHVLDLIVIGLLIGGIGLEVLTLFTAEVPELQLRENSQSKN